MTSSFAAAVAERVPEFGPAAGFVIEALRRAPPAPLVSVTVPAPAVPLEALDRAIPDADASVLWDPPDGPGFAAAGVAAELGARGRERIASIRIQAGALWPQLHVIRHPAVDTPPPRLYGGFAFAPGAADAEPWRAFGDARFLLPQWTYGRDGDRAWLTVTVRADQRSGGEHWAAAVQQALATLAAPAPEREPEASVVALRPLERALWTRQVEAIRRAIVKREVDKIVAARCTEVELSGPVDVHAVLPRLRALHGDCFRFGFELGDVGFAGASPERLVSRRGDRVATEALAGSIARANGAGALLASQKDRGEQQLVVDAIEAALGPLCASLEVPREPEIRELRDVLHLRTPIRGRTAGEVHVLDLVAALHPTPAVGGVPTRAALTWITELETQARGWYASPVGWFDERGDGEFTVAIRSGVLRGRRAFLYTGAGIVRDSDPDAEYDETELKQQALLAALGVRR